jgi:hypothetical protein
MLSELDQPSRRSIAWTHREPCPQDYPNHVSASGKLNSIFRKFFTNDCAYSGHRRKRIHRLATRKAVAPNLDMTLRCFTVTLSAPVAT